MAHHNTRKGFSVDQLCRGDEGEVAEGGGIVGVAFNGDGVGSILEMLEAVAVVGGLDVEGHVVVVAGWQVDVEGEAVAAVHALLAAVEGQRVAAVGGAAQLGVAAVVVDGEVAADVVVGGGELDAGDGLILSREVELQHAAEVFEHQVAGGGVGIHGSGEVGAVGAGLLGGEGDACGARGDAGRVDGAVGAAGGGGIASEVGDGVVAGGDGLEGVGDTLVIDGHLVARFPYHLAFVGGIVDLDGGLAVDGGFFD